MEATRIGEFTIQDHSEDDARFFRHTREDLIAALGPPDEEGNAPRSPSGSPVIMQPYSSGRTLSPEEYGTARFMLWRCKREPGDEIGASPYCLAVRGDSLGTDKWAMLQTCFKHYSLR